MPLLVCKLASLHGEKERLQKEADNSRSVGCRFNKQGLLWGWTSTPTWQEQDWTGIVMYSSTLPWYQWELFTHTGHQWGRARWHFTSPFPWCHWIGEGREQGGSELSSYSTLQHQSSLSAFHIPIPFFFAGQAHREKKSSYKWYPH